MKVARRCNREDMENHYEVYIRFLLALLIGLMGHFEILSGQNCSLESLFDQEVEILDESTISLRIKVENAAFDDLSDPFQGICGIRLNFNHSNLADLVMTLTSPGGQTVVLIGPANKNGTIPVLPLFPIEHDITFLPRINTATPDPDLPVEWTNNNLNWGMNAPYSGSYYPFNGDLQLDMSSGSVNGIWELTIQDAFINDIGLLRIFEIDFCIDNGIQCSPCESRAGVFQDSIIGICQGEDIDIVGLYGSDNFDTALYEDVFVIYENDQILAPFDSIDFRLLDQGTYEVYGLNIDMAQTDSLLADLEFLSRTEMLLMLDGAGGQYCASRSEALIVEVNIPVDTIEMDTVFLCLGEFVVISGDTLNNSGRYTFFSATCDSVTNISIVASDLIADLQEDTIYLSCVTNSVTTSIQVQSSMAVGITWTDINNNSIGIDSTMTINDVGSYTVVVTDGICADTQRLTVLNPVDTMFISLILSGVSLNCRDSVITATVISNFAYDSIVWDKDGGRFSEGSTLDIRLAGSYIVSVYGQNGCILSESFDIEDNTQSPQVQLVLDSLNCRDRSTVLAVRSSDDALSYAWSDGDNNLLDTTSTLIVDAAGIYKVSIVNQNFCDTLLQGVVPIDTQAIIIRDVPNEIILNCQLERQDIRPVVLGSNILNSYWIRNSDDTISSDTEIILGEPGLFELVVEGENFCVSSAGVIVDIDTVAPQLTIAGRDLDCNNLEVTLIAQSDSDDLIYAWAGSFDRKVGDTSIVTTTTGIYAVGALDTINECTSIDTFVVRSDLTEPTIVLEGDSVLTCNQSVVEVTNVGFDHVQSQWMTPDGSIVTEDMIRIDLPGRYVYRATRSNGCYAEEEWIVSDDLGLVVPDLPDTIRLNCLLGDTIIAPVLTSEIAEVRWFAYGDTIIDNQRLVNQEGVVTAQFEGTNGCLIQRSIVVVSDMTPPQIGIINDTIDCNTPVVTIGTDIVSETYIYEWFGGYDGRGDTSFVLVSQPEILMLSVTDIDNGCTSRISITVEEDTRPVLPTIVRTTMLSCERPIGRIAVTADQPIDVVWTDPDGIEYFSPDGIVDRAGSYSIDVVGVNGCNFFTEWEVIDLRTPVEVQIDTQVVISCQQPSVTVSPLQISPDASLFWVFRNGDTLNTPMVEISSPDLSGLYVIDGMGCDTFISIGLAYDTMRPEVMILSGDTTLCTSSTLDLQGTPVDQTDIEVTWFRDNSIYDVGDVVSRASESGAYRLEFRDMNNGCIGSDEVNVRISTDPLRSIDVEVIHPICENDNDGSIRVVDITGGEGDLTIRFNGSPIDLQEIQFPLIPEFYRLEVMDEFGCMIDTLVEIVPGVMYAIDIGSDLTVNRGDELLIVPSYSGSIPANTDFSIDGTMVGSDIDSILFMPTASGIVTARSTSVEGCIAEDSLYLDVLSNLGSVSLYIPNILVTNSAIGNNTISIQLPDDVLSLDNFAIYDRWGQQLVRIENYQDRSPIVLWDGTFKGQFVTQGVYIFKYEITTIFESRRKVVVGDITVLR